MKDLSLLLEEIKELLKQSELPAFAVVDFDNTCIENDITEAALHYMARNNLFRDGGLLEDRAYDAKSEEYSKAVFDHYYELLNNGDIKTAYEFISKILSGFSAEEIGPLVKNVLEHEGKNIVTEELFGRKIAKGIVVKKEVIDIMDFLKSNGVTVWIVSASIEILVMEAMRYFKIDANVIGVKNVIANDIITTQLQMPTPIIEGKVTCIKMLIDPEKKPLLGAGDSINDLPMLEYCQMKVVVDRNNALSEKAKENNWILIK